MNELKKHWLLLSIVALLVVIKWGYIPLSDWQNALYFEVKQKQKRLLKSSRVLEKSDLYNQQNIQLQSSLAIANDVFFNEQDDSLFKLEQQKFVEQLLSKSNLTLTRIVWENTLESVEPKIKHYKMNVFFSGRATDMVRYVTELEQHKPYIEVSDFIFNIKKSHQAPLGNVSGNLTLNLYMKPVKQILVKG